MPHVVVEYSSNLAGEGDVRALLAKINASLIAERGDAGPVFPKGGVRSRAIGVDDWSIADGADPDAGFVHLTVRIAKGRTDAQKKKAFDAVFEIVKAHYADAFARRGLALSMDVDEFADETWKHNNLHGRASKESAP